MKKKELEIAITTYTVAYKKGYTQCQEDMLKKEELKDWDVTLNDGLEDEVWDEKLIQELINETVPEPFATPEELQEKPYVSDDFQIGPDGAYEHTDDVTPREKAKDELIKVLWWQVMDLTMMSKIELGDDVIAEVKRLQDIIDKPNE
jgi:hypothetical protein